MKHYTLTSWRGTSSSLYKEVGSYDRMLQILLQEFAHIAPPEEIRLGEMSDRPGSYLAYVGDHFNNRDLYFVIEPT